MAKFWKWAEEMRPYNVDDNDFKPKPVMNVHFGLYDYRILTKELQLVQKYKEHSEYLKIKKPSEKTKK